MLKAIYYMHFALWRACRASKDPSFGEFRVQALLMLLEASFVAGLLFLTVGDQLVNLSLPVYTVATVAPMLILNIYLFWDPKKRKPFEAEFARYPPNRRRRLDALTLLAAIGAVLLPIIVLSK